MKVIDQLKRDVVVSIMLLQVGSFLLYTSRAAMTRSLTGHKRWRKDDPEDLYDDLDGQRYGKWKISVNSNYIFLE
jgi:hypothetical protein